MSYDALGRQTIVAYPDGSSKTWSYSGLTTLSKDEANVPFSRTYDPRGRVVQVWEPDPSHPYVTQCHSGCVTNLDLNQETDYIYDSLGNLATVTQMGMSTDTPRVRTFMYDSLSRLTSASNPESGITCYGYMFNGVCSSIGGYDSNGNVLVKTDSRNMGVKYDYDSLNRPTTQYNIADTVVQGGSGTTNQTAATVAATYYYDGTYPSNANSALSGPTPYLMGRLGYMHSVVPAANGYDDQYFGYDATGRLSLLTESSPSEYGSTHHATSVGYDLAGDVSSIAYPDGTGIVQTYDSAGRLLSVRGGTHSTVGQTYVSSIVYAPDGSPQTIQYGNAVSKTISENNRLQTCEVSALTNYGFLSDLQYYYSNIITSGQKCAATSGNTGNITYIVDGLNSNHSQSFGYDSLNRLNYWYTPQFGGSMRQQFFSYDPFGNIQQKDQYPPGAGVADPLASPAPANTQTPTYTANNQLTASAFQCTGVSSGAVYDAAGNQLCQGVSNTNARGFIWNAQGQLSSLYGMQNNNTYFPLSVYSYDGQGERVRADQLVPQSNPTTTQSWREYSYLNGSLLAERDQSGLWTDYVYAAGRPIVRLKSTKPLLHVSGVRDSTNLAGGVEGPASGVASNLAGMVLKTGDRLAVSVKQSQPTNGGIAFIFTDGTGTGGADDIQTGTPLYFNSASDQAWHHFVGNLDQYAGKTISYVLIGIHSQTPVGNFDMWMDDISLFRADGSIYPIFTGQPMTVPAFSGTNGSAHNMESGLVNATVDAPGSATYYLADQVGTAQFQISGSGWPIWKGEFAPFGQELDSDPTINRLKFTGKERDTESGLDYFGARYYGSNMGRMMSPDPLGGHLEDPQTLNNTATLETIRFLGPIPQDWTSISNVRRLHLAVPNKP